MADEQKLVEVPCSICGKPVFITQHQYETRMRQKYPTKCKACISEIYRQNRLKVMATETEEQKKARYDKVSKTMKNYIENMSDEDYKNRVDKIVNGIHNMSDETKDLHSKRVSEGVKKYMASLSEEEKARRSQMVSDEMYNRWANMTDQERIEFGQKISEGQLNRSQEAKDESNRKRSEAVHAYWKNLTPDQFYEWRKSKRDWWASLNDSEYKEVGDKRLKGIFESEKWKNSLPSQAEVDFINLLNISKLKYEVQYISKIKHPDFDKLFPQNNASKSPVVSPFHKWDFKINLPKGDVLIDVDGSIHFNKSYYTYNKHTDTSFNHLEYNKFNDSKRPYQTDGLKAFVIEAPKDIVTRDSTVRNINTNEVMRVSDLMALLMNWNGTSVMETEKEELKTVLDSLSKQS